MLLISYVYRSKLMPPAAQMMAKCESNKHSNGQIHQMLQLKIAELIRGDRFSSEFQAIWPGREPYPQHLRPRPYIKSTWSSKVYYKSQALI